MRDLPVLSSSFFSPRYLRHNVARLSHLDSLGLDLHSRKVIEVGAGVGEHTLFYLYRNCRIVCVEGRADLCGFLSRRLGLQAHCIDLDRFPDRLLDLGHFEIMHSYGLLYHLSQPERFLDVASKIADTLLLETCVSATEDGSLEIVPEGASDRTQALGGWGCRPSRQWVFEKLKELWPFVYCPRTQPCHPEFPLQWPPPVEARSTFVRAVFVATRTELTNPLLTPELPRSYQLLHEP